MTRATPIASLVEAMLASGAGADVIVCAVEAAELHGQVRGKALVTTGSQRKRGTRLADEWQPSERCIAYAIDHGMSREQIEREIERFKNYWLEKTGAGATKLTWEGTWKNWILTATDGRHATTRNNNGRRHGSTPTTGRAPTGSDAILAGMGRIASRIDERRTAKVDGGRKVSDASDTPRELDLK
jgi:hypothetical protein